MCADVGTSSAIRVEQNGKTRRLRALVPSGTNAVLNTRIQIEDEGNAGCLYARSSIFGNDEVMQTLFLLDKNQLLCLYLSFASICFSFVSWAVFLKTKCGYVGFFLLNLHIHTVLESIANFHHVSIA